MNMDKFEKFNRKFATGIDWVARVAIVLMMLITIADIIGTKVFLHPVFGSIDMMMMIQLVCVSFATASTLLAGRHIQVEFFVLLLPKRLQAFIDSIVCFLGLFVFLIIVWLLFRYGYTLQTTGETTATARIPLYPFAYGAAFGCIPVCFIYFSLLVESILRLLKR